MPRDQRRGRKREAAANAGHTEPSRDSVEARGPASSTQRVAGVTQRVPKASHCFRGLTQRVLRLTQSSRRLTQCFRVVREGFVGQVF